MGLVGYGLVKINDGTTAVADQFRQLDSAYALSVTLLEWVKRMPRMR